MDTASHTRNILVSLGGGGRSGLEIEARPETLGERKNPSYLCRWIANRSFDAEATLEFNPETASDFAGLALVQNEKSYAAIGLTKGDDGRNIVMLIRHDKKGKRVLDTANIPVGEVSVKVEGRDETLRFYWRQKGGEWARLGGDECSDILTTQYAGGFVGATVGLYATSKSSSDPHH